MATFNTNYQAIVLSGGNSYSLYELGDGLTASTVHQVFCISAGTISLTALGGGNFVWGATAGQSIGITLGKCSVTSGLFAGFKSQHIGKQVPYYKY